MKKLLCAVVSMMLLCGVLSAVAEAVVPFLTVYLNTIEQNGASVSAAEAGRSVSIAFCEDGTAVLTSDGESSEYTWTQNEDSTLTLTSDGKTLTLTQGGGVLTLEAGDGAWVFSTEMPVSVDFGTTVPADDAAAFNGTWRCTHVVMDGTVTPVEAMTDYWSLLFGDGAADTVVIDNGTAYLCGSEDGLAFTLDGGVLTCAAEDGESAARTIRLTDAGYLVYDLPGLGLTLCCVSAE